MFENVSYEYTNSVIIHLQIPEQMVECFHWIT